MADREKVKRELERMKEDAYVSAVHGSAVDDALTLLKEQDDDIRNLISDLDDLQKEHEKLLDKKIPLITNGQEVVRCKDCKHYRATPGYCAYDRIWQENKGHVWGMYCKQDWFCADGEKAVK